MLSCSILSHTKPSPLRVLSALRFLVFCLLCRQEFRNYVPPGAVRQSTPFYHHFIALLSQTSHGKLFETAGTRSSLYGVYIEILKS